MSVPLCQGETVGEINQSTTDNGHECTPMSKDGRRWQGTEMPMPTKLITVLFFFNDFVNGTFKRMVVLLSSQGRVLVVSGACQ